MAHPNEDMLKRGYAAYNSGDMDTIQALFDDDIVWHGGGSNQLTGDYRGFQEIMGFFGKVMKLTGGTFVERSTTSWPTTRTASYW